MPRLLFRPRRFFKARSAYRPALLLPILLLCLALALSACGGGGSSSGGSSASLTHIKGSSATITKPMLNHWMGALVGEDFHASVGSRAPGGLVAEPADYGACLEAAKTVVPRSPSGKLKLSDAQIEAKCRELHEALKAQAIAFLLSVQWTVQEGEEQGLHISEAELHQYYKRYQKEVLGGSEASARKYLAERHWSVADLLYMLKRSMLVSRILPKFEAKVKRAGGGEKTYARLALARYDGLIAKTSCEPGYVVLGCKEYRQPAYAPPSAAVILEGLAGGAG